MAFALNRWNEDRKDRNSEHKILLEIQHGLKSDLNDIGTNIWGHQKGLQACDAFVLAINGQEIDSVAFHYHHLFRDYVSIQNRSGYEALRSNGLQLVENDSLRSAIINLYDFNYEILEKLEESYQEMQYFSNYFEDMNEILIEHMQVDSAGNLTGFKIGDELEEGQRKYLLNQLNRIKENRAFVTDIYQLCLEEVKALDGMIRDEIES